MVTLDRNFRHGHHELDIIARDGRIIVFVEVRDAHERFFSSSAATITPKKREKNLHQAAKSMERSPQIPRPLAHGHRRNRLACRHARTISRRSLAEMPLRLPLRAWLFESVDALG